jgi:hypothetical protein
MWISQYICLAVKTKLVADHLSFSEKLRSAIKIPASITEQWNYTDTTSWYKQTACLHNPDESIVPTETITVRCVVCLYGVLIKIHLLRHHSGTLEIHAIIQYRILFLLFLHPFQNTNDYNITLFGNKTLTLWLCYMYQYPARIWFHMLLVHTVL